MEEYEIFTKKYFLNNSNIKRFSSMVVMNRVKKIYLFLLINITYKLFRNDLVRSSFGLENISFGLPDSTI